MLKHIYSASYYFSPVDFGAGIGGSAVSDTIDGVGFAITTAPLGRIAFGVTAGVAGKLVEQLLDRKPEIDKSAVLVAGASGFIPIKTKSYAGKGFSGKTYVSCWLFLSILLQAHFNNQKL